jgi:regulator of protease activity HflC (stomatin/prohibitin superfamily)
LAARERSTNLAEHVIENHEAGLLYVEGRLVERLAPGRHAFWTVGRKIEVKHFDLRPQAVEITAQEMLTRDRIALRVTLTAFRRIADPERVEAAVADVDGWPIGSSSSRSARRWPRARSTRCCRPRTRSTRSFAPSCASASRTPASR